MTDVKYSNMSMCQYSTIFYIGIYVNLHNSLYIYYSNEHIQFLSNDILNFSVVLLV